ncbi:MAG: TonB-dependent receptor plug domain-containing protein [Desulfovibrio sp.]|jgi:hemoglobin/transferrin/lactoferrin receptor protein
MRMLRKAAALIPLLGALLCPLSGVDAACAAQGEAGDVSVEQTLEPVVVTARGYAGAVSATPGGVGIVDRQEILETMPTGVGDALDRVPGVGVSTDSPWGADVVIRGLARDSVVVLIDGCRLNVTTDINGRLGLVNPDDVERVEVLKGPISTLYGTGSTGGVVNIVTRQGHYTDEPGVSGEVAAAWDSNPQGPDAYGNLMYNGRDFWLYASGGWRERADSYSGGGDVIPNSGFSDLQGKVAAAYAWNDRHETMLQYQFTEADEVGLPGTGTAALPDNADVTLAQNDRTFVQLRQRYANPDATLSESELAVSYQLLTRDPRIDNFTGGPVRMVDPYAEHETVALNWRNVLNLGAHRVTVGVDAWNWYMTSERTRYLRNGNVLRDSPTPDTDMFSGGLFLEDDWTLSPAWSLNLGGRLDSVLIENEETPNLKARTKRDLDWGGHAGLTWAFTPGWSATGIVAASYRTPNTLELYKDINIGPGVREMGDPDLRSEKSRYAELGLHYTGTRWSASGAAFLNMVDDLITSELESAGLYRMANAAEARIYGLEGSVQWRFAPGWQAYADAAWTEGRNEDTGEWLRFVAPLNGLVGVRQDLDNGLWWAVESRWAAEQHQVPEDALRTDAWAVLDARCGYGFEAGGLRNELTLAVTNLLDERYHNHLATSRGVELHAPGVGLQAEWRLRF